MVIRPANRDTKKRKEFVKGEKKRQRAEEGWGDNGGHFQNTFRFLFKKTEQEKKGVKET